MFWIWQAFTDLNLRRPVVGMGEPSYILYSEIDAYCRIKNIFLPSERERLIKMIDRLDREWMRIHLEKREKEQKETARKGALPPPSHSPPRHKPRPSTRTEV